MTTLCWVDVVADLRSRKFGSLHVAFGTVERVARGERGLWWNYCLFGILAKAMKCSIAAWATATNIERAIGLVR